MAPNARLIACGCQSVLVVRGEKALRIRGLPLVIKPLFVVALAAHSRGQEPISRCC
jgi:hypothetical protein